jgi:hypothetical protein
MNAKTSRNQSDGLESIRRSEKEAQEDGLWKVLFPLDGKPFAGEWVFAQPLSATTAAILSTPHYTYDASRGDVVVVKDYQYVPDRDRGFLKRFVSLKKANGVRLELIYTAKDEHIDDAEHKRRLEAIRSHFAAALPQKRIEVEPHGRTGFAMVVVPLPPDIELHRRLLDSCPGLVGHSLQEATP